MNTTQAKPMPANPLFEAVSEQRAKGAVSLKIAWRGALESLPALPADLLETLAPALPSPDTVRQFGRFLAREKNPAAALTAFFKEVDESDESLEEWLSAFEVLAYFLESTPHRPTLGEAVGYLHCCAAVAHTGARYASFPMTVETMLETYGYSGGRED